MTSQAGRGRIPAQTWMAAALALSLVGPLSAQSPPRAQPLSMSMYVDASSFRNRTPGPYPLSLQIQWNGNRLLEGRVRVTFNTQFDLPCTLLSDELTLNAGESHVSLMIPPLMSLSSVEQVDLLLEWVNGDEVQWRGTAPLRIAGAWRRSTVTGVCATPSPTIRTLETQLSLGELLPVDSGIADGTRLVMNLPHEMRPSDISVEPLQLCVLDALLLDVDAIRALSASQRSSVLTWLRAGGRVVICESGTPWRDSEIAFLQELLVESPEYVPRPADPIGLAWPGADVDSGLVSARFGLGNVLIVADPTVVDRNPGAVRRAAAVLWDVRVGTRGLLDEVADGRAPANSLMNHGIGFGPLVRQRPVELRGLASKLLPQGVSAVPLWVIGAVLALYVLLIGPAEYFALGLIGRRKWKWITFPLTTLAVSAGALAISRWHLSASGVPSSLVIRDLLPGAEVARETRISMIFEQVRKDVVTPVSRSLYTPLNTYQEFNPLAMQMMTSGFNPLSASPTFSVEGRLPHAARIVRPVEEFVGQMQREVTLPVPAERHAPDPEAAAFPWDDLPDFRNREELRSFVRQAFGEKASAALITGGERQTLTGNFSLFQSEPADPWRGTPLANQARRRGLPPGFVEPPVDFQEGLLDALTTGANGIFNVVSRNAPSGSWALEDLPLIDPTNPDELALAILVPNDNGWTLFRRLYRRDAEGRWK
ncbi:MAG: hypothetical protein KF774_16695 [Planctomyces sp.]|nr:hypothetical protein [Planctomyces sp.]